jgi:SAM-dependent methyltransferase
MESTAYRQFVELEEQHFWFRGRRRIFFHLLDRLLRGRTDLTILEIGCGAGGFLGPLSAYGQVVGIDISHELIRFCQQRGPNRVLVGSGYDLPIRKHSVDLVAMFDTIEHIPDDERVLAQCREALKPGGKVFLSVPAYQFLYSENDRIAHHQRRYTRTELRKKLSAAGFRPDRVTYFNSFLFPMILPVVLLKKMKERLFGPDEKTNLSHRIFKPANELFAGIMSSERLLLQEIEFPFGHSIIGMATAA